MLPAQGAEPVAPGGLHRERADRRLVGLAVERGGKRPVCGGWLTDATTETALIDRWWPRDAGAPNVGVVADESFDRSSLTSPRRWRCLGLESLPMATFQGGSVNSMVAGLPSRARAIVLALGGIAALSPEAFSAFLAFFAGAVSPHLAGDAYVVLGASEWPTLDRVLRDAGFHWSATIIWVKDAFVLGRSQFHRRYEPLWYGWRASGSSSHQGRRDLDDVWEVPRPRRSKHHPTMKPVELVERAIEASNAAGDRVLDPFGGSGSTLIAAERTGRVASLVELDPRYCDVILARWKAFTGGRAERVSAIAAAA